MNAFHGCIKTFFITYFVTRGGQNLRVVPLPTDIDIPFKIKRVQVIRDDPQT